MPWHKRLVAGLSLGGSGSRPDQFIRLLFTDPISCYNNHFNIILQSTLAPLVVCLQVMD